MFNAKKEKDKIVKFIRDYFDEYNLGGVVIGISGGKDSGVVAGLFAEAIGAENIGDLSNVDLSKMGQIVIPLVLNNKEGYLPLFVAAFLFSQIILTHRYRDLSVFYIFENILKW